MRAAIVFCIFFIALPANAQHVYKCAKDRDVSYQSAPCDETQTLVKQWEAAPESELPVAEVDHGQSKRKQAEADTRPSGLANSRSRTHSGSHARSTSSISAAGNRCKAAKARREAKLISVGLKRTFDLLRKLDDAVHDACK